LCFGLTHKQLHSLAYDFSAANNIKNKVNSAAKPAGKDWLVLFLKRDLTISFRIYEGTSIKESTHLMTQ